ncbi:ATP-grasp domain-containing protein [Streptomyces sp. NRRL F-5126]|uniref:ATP-grasp domain-containing protein n=1 Tax=Streptomyces sp. NRRL F-5126 TaxID=1463857 RepID=UPI00099E169E|nr:ATP-grasp domain-containing protein [Streptomyces sp. NRRL F-5126]
MNDRRVIVVIFDKGAVSASSIAQSLNDSFDLVFAIHDGPFTDQMLPFLTETSEVVHLVGDPEVDAAKLARHCPDGILTFSESMLPSTARLATILGLPFHTPGTVRRLTNKFEQRSVLRASGVDRIVTAAIDSESDWERALAKVGLPAVVKPVRGSGSSGVCLIRDESEASHHRTRLFGGESTPGHLLAEEYLQGRPSLPFGDYVSVESLCTPQGITHVAVTGKFPLRPPFAEQGSFWPSQLPAHEVTAVTELVSRALIALQVSVGITHTEVQLTPTGPRIIEVNGRLGGQIDEIATRSDSVDLIKINALLAVGDPIGVEPACAGKVVFLNILSAPTHPCTLTAVHGVRSVRRIPGITGYTSLAQQGQYFPGAPEMHRLGVLYGEACDHEAMIAIVDQARSTLSFEFSETSHVPTSSGSLT